MDIHSDEATASLLAATHVLVTVPPAILISDKHHNPDHDHQSDDPISLAEHDVLSSYARISVNHPFCMGSCTAWDPVLNANLSNFRSMIGERRSKFQWLGYLSSTSVYGNHNGHWVDESSSLHETDTKGITRRGIERKWMDLWHRYEIPVHIFRCGGIYGPGRNTVWNLWKPNDASFSPSQKEQRRRREKQRYTARCHVLDICRALEASALAPTPGEIFNVVDDDPSSREDVAQFSDELVELLNSTLSNTDRRMCDSKQAQVHRMFGYRDGATKDRVQREREERGNTKLDGFSAQALARLKGEKRVSNRKLKEALGFAFEFPSYKEGLLALAQDDIRPFFL